MGKNDRSTVENRVYLFRDLASAFLADNGRLLASQDDGERRAAQRALADIAHACCVMADSAGDPAEKVRKKLG